MFDLGQNYPSYAVEKVTFSINIFRHNFFDRSLVRILSDKFTFFRAVTASKNAIEKVFESDCAASLCRATHTQTHTHPRHEQPRRMSACALVELVGLVGLTRCQSYTPGSTVGRVVYHSMVAVAGAAVDVSAVVTLAAYKQQQQQRSMAVWNLIMDGYDDNTELDAENDEPTREIKRRRVC